MLKLLLLATLGIVMLCQLDVSSGQMSNSGWTALFLANYLHHRRRNRLEKQQREERRQELQNQLAQQLTLSPRYNRAPEEVIVEMLKQDREAVKGLYKTTSGAQAQLPFDEANIHPK